MKKLHRQSPFLFTITLSLDAGVHKHCFCRKDHFADVFRPFLGITFSNACNNILGIVKKKKASFIEITVIKIFFKNTQN